MKRTVLGLMLATAGVALLACGDPFTSPRYVNVLRLIPDSVDLLVGETVAIGIRAFDQDRDSLPDRVQRTEVYSEDPSVAEVVGIEPPFVTIRALAPGRAYVFGQLGFGLDRAVIRVQAAPTAPAPPR
ncbi:MAG: hypothetical protein RLN75_08120 [Longimicrobiales bacterium]